MTVPTLKTIATVVTIIGSISGGVITCKNYIDGKQAENVRQAIEHEKHDYELDRRLDRIEASLDSMRVAVRMAVSNDSPKQRELVDQVLTLQTQLRAVKQTTKSLKDAIGQDDDDQIYPADAPSVPKP